MLKGWKTIIVGVGLAVAPAALQYLAGIDWAQYVSPEWAPTIAAAIMIAMRLVSTTPVGKK